MSHDVKGRRKLMTGLGVTAAAVALGSRGAAAQASPAPFQPARHAQDDWMDALPGKHRVILDITSVEGIPEGLRFAGNLFAGHKAGYGVGEAELAIIMVLRHGATAYGYTDAIWGKYGKSMGGREETAPPTANQYDTGERKPLSGLAKRGVHFVVCGSASMGLARRIAGPNGDADATMKEMTANMVPNSHIMVGVAGVVPVAHAQERGYSYLFVG